MATSVLVSNCFTAQTIPTLFGNDELNPDVGGFAVAIANIVINFALPILLRWSEEPDDARTAIVILLSQVYPMMIATAGSINSDNLSLFDAHFVIAVTASPVSVYLSYSSFRDLIGRPNTLFKQLEGKAGRVVIRYLGIALPFLWLTINIIISFSPRAFRNSSEYCQNMTFMRWFEFQAVSNFIGVLDVMGRRDLWNDLQGRGGLGAISLTALWIWAVYLVRHRHHILEEFQFRRHKRARINHWRVTRLWLWIYDIPASGWYVITASHPWIVFVIICCLHWSWVLGIAKGMMTNRTYQLSYGQITSLFSAVPPAVAVWNLLRKQWIKLLEFLTKLPTFFYGGLHFLVTGQSNPWPQKREADDDRRAFHEDKLKNGSDRWACVFEPPWLCIAVLWLVMTGLDGLWIYAYVRAGSTPNPRIVVNNPHGAWKPFSVTMYIYGYFVCIVNILLWTMVFTKPLISTTSARTSVCLMAKALRKEACIFDQRIFRHWAKLLVIPVAFLLSVGPLFAPFAALPLAQEHQWTHLCDPFEGEVILRGATDPAHNSTASFYYPDHDSMSNPRSRARSLQFMYWLHPNMSTNSHTLKFNTSSLSSTAEMAPELLRVAYNMTRSTVEAYCIGTSGNKTAVGLCGYGNFTSDPYLAFNIHNTRNDSFFRLRAVDEEWEFPDDAPSTVLRFEDPVTRKLGNDFIHTAVTQRSHCNTLKVCLASRDLDLATIIPIGRILISQAIFSEYCSRPRIYSI